MTEFPGARFVGMQPGEGTPLLMGVGGDYIIFKATGEDTGQTHAFLEYHAEPRSIGTSLHSHPAHEEGFYVVSGALGMQHGDEKLVALPGAYVLIPRDMPHAFWNAGDEPCVFVGVFSPAGFENLFIERDALLKQGLTRASPEIEALRMRYGTVELGPPPGAR